jgi:nitronate monooxygenase
MNIELPKIIQGGMGFGISDWRLARTVSKLGQLGVVSGTALDAVLARKLQDGDPDGHVRRALEHFPFPGMAKRVLDRYFIPNGLPEGTPYRPILMYNLEGCSEAQELCIVGNYVEVFLAKEGHNHPVGINFLEKIQIPHLPAIYGAMLADVSVIIMGAGIPLRVPGILDALTQHEAVEYPVNVIGADNKNEIFNLPFNPRQLFESEEMPAPLTRPDFLPIVSSELLANILIRKATGNIDGFIVEGNTAGGHNAPPRGKMTLSDRDEPVYGPRDVPNLEAFRKFGLPFWLAGQYGSPEGLQRALNEGAAGIQAGTAFALCEESGMLASVRKELVREALAGKARIFTDPQASPTGFPFKVADLAGSLSDEAVYQQRRRVCDIGILRQPYRRPDGKLGYRCASEPIAAYVAKGGFEKDTVGRKCLCNALAANIGMPQRLSDGTDEKCLITIGDDLVDIGRFCTAGQIDYSAADVINTMLGTSK